MMNRKLCSFATLPGLLAVLCAGALTAQLAAVQPVKADGAAQVLPVATEKLIPVQRVPWLPEA